MKKLLLLCVPLMFSCGEMNTEKDDNKVDSEKNKTNTEEKSVDLCECMEGIVSGNHAFKTRKEQYDCDQIVSNVMGVTHWKSASSKEAASKFEEIMKNCGLKSVD